MIEISLRRTPDKESKAKSALHTSVKAISNTVHKKVINTGFTYPQKWALWPSMDGIQKGIARVPGNKMTKGYHWYKLASDVRLTQDSKISVFAGFFVTLDGAVSDNSELGQKYDVWVSCKITGKDFLLFR